MFIIKQVCQTKECVSVAAEIIESADMSADPCTDFYQVLLSGNFAFGWISSRNTIQTESDNNVIPLPPFPVCLRWLAEEQPNPKREIQLEHFQKAVAGTNLNIKADFPKSATF